MRQTSLLLVILVILGCSICVIANSVNRAALNDVALLLPALPGKEKLTYTLSASDNCYRWSSTRPSVATVQPIYNVPGDSACSRSVLITAVGSAGMRSKAFIMAHDLATSRVLRCEVFVDSIASIEITHTSTSIYVNEREVLELLAFDGKGNLFSTIAGLPFQWTLQAVDNVPPSSLLRLISRARGKQEGDGGIVVAESVLVEGKSTGKVVITAELADEGSSKDVAPAAFNLAVFEPLVLSPPEEVFVIPEATLQYDLQTRRGDVESVPLPNSRFTFNSHDESVVTVSDTALVQARGLGTTEIALTDGNMPENVVYATIHVSTPITLSVDFEGVGDVFEDSVVHLVVGRSYNVQISAYDRNGNRFRKTDNMKFEFGHDTHYLDRSGSVLTALVIGTTTVTASLGQTCSVAVRVVIAPQVTLHPSSALLPLGDKPHTLGLEACGGDGIEYQWISGDDTVVDVAPNGNVTPIGRGKCQITAASRQDLSNRASASVTVDSPTSLVFVPSVVEVEVDGHLILGVNATNSEGRFFHPQSCHSLDMSWHVDDPSSFTVVEESECKHACTCVKLVAMRAANTAVRARYKTMEATVTVAGYNPLRVKHKSDHILVTLGSSVVLGLDGGPQPWVFDPSTHGVSVETADSGVANVVKLSSMSYRITCLQHGQESIIARVANRASAKNPHPAVATATISFACRVPQAVILQPIGGDFALLVDGDDEKPECVGMGDTINPQGSRYLARNDRILSIKALVLDQDGHVYCNASTMPLTWSSDKEELAAFSSETVDAADLMLGRGYGVVGVSANLTNGVGGSISLDLISGVELSPKQMLLYNSPKHSLRVHTVGGSGHFEFSVNNTDVAELIPGDIAKVRPLRVGSVRVTVRDLCFADGTSAMAHADVAVSDVSALQLRARSRIEVGRDMQVEARAIGVHGALFPSSQFAIMNLSLSLDLPVLELNAGGLELMPYHAMQSLRGLTVGSSVLAASCCDESQSSPPVQISVHSPLRIAPRALVMLPGSVFHVSTSGGPESGVQMLYSLDDDELASVDGSGVIRAKAIGTTVLHATVVGHDSMTNEQSEFGSDSIDIRVADLDAIAIQSKSSELLVGEQMRARVEGLNGQDAFALGSGMVEIEWYVADEQVLSVSGSITATLTGLTPGTTTVSARVTAAKHVPHAVGLVDEVTITVSESLAIVGPKTLQLTPHAQTRIHTSGDRLRKLSYSLVGGRCEQPCNSSEVISVSADTGKIVAYESIGDAVVMVTDKDKSHIAHTTLVSVVVRHIGQLHVQAPATVPVGGTVHVTVTPRDDLGMAFASHDSVVFIVESNNRGILSPPRSAVLGSRTNSTPISVRALQQGEAVIRVSLRDAPYMSDYVVIRVTSAITPAMPTLHIGAEVAFKCSLHDAGTWGSSDESVLSVNTDGTAVASGYGTAQVIRRGESGVQAFTDVTVVSVSSIAVASSVPFITNVQPKPYSIPLSFTDDDGINLVNKRGIKQNIIVSCSVSETLWAHSRVEDSVCVVLPMSPSSDMPPSVLNVHVSATDMTSSYRVDHHIAIPFKAAFVILNPAVALYLGGSDATASVTVRGHADDLLAVADDTSLVSVQPISSSETSVVYQIRVLTSQSFNSTVTIRCFVTGQEERIPVSFTQTARTAPITTPIATPITTPVTATESMVVLTKPVLLSLLFVLLTIAMFFLVQRRRSIPVPIGSPAPNTAPRTTATPQRGSPWRGHGQSPYRTPKSSIARRRLGGDDYF